MVRVGLVGLGGMGTVHHSNYQHISDAQVVAATGNSEKDKENAKEWGLILYKTVEEMIEGENLDVVDICTPTFLHKEHVMAALKMGKPVICEKPLALKIEDAHEIINEAKAKNLNIYVGQVLRFFKEYQALTQVIKSGEYGRVLDGHFVRLSARPRWNQGGWMFEKEKSGQVPFDLHIHDLDYLVSVFGPPKDFSYVAAGDFIDPDNENQSFKEHFRFDYDFGEFHISAEAAWYNADYPWTAEYRVYFEEAVMENKAGKVVAYQFDKEPRVFDTEEKIKIPTGINVPPTGVYLEELSHFIDCVKRGEASDKIKTGELLTVIKILSDIVWK